MEEFKDKNEEYVSEWLVKEGFKANVVESFEKNEIDGNVFISLNEKMMRELVPTIGPLSKLMAKHKALSADQKFHGTVDISPITSCISDINEVTSECPNSQDIITHEDIEEGKPTKRQKNDQENLTYTINFDKHSNTLPDPFKFPVNYSPLVTASLASATMTPHTIEKFITEVARAAFSFKCYPLPEEFGRLAQQCIEKYPFVTSANGGYGHIEAGLKRRFKEFRRTSKLTSRVSVKKESTSIDSFNGEDEFSYSRNISVLQTEVKKAKPNLTIISQLMELTFQLRRNEILTSPTHVKLIIEKFPALTIFEQLVEEAQRVLSTNNLRNVVVERWLEVKVKIVDL